jgi:hypothetical protein
MALTGRETGASDINPRSLPMAASLKDGGVRFDRWKFEDPFP